MKIFQTLALVFLTFTALAAIPPDVVKLAQENKYAEALARVDALLRAQPGDAELAKLRAEIAAQVPATGASAASAKIPDAQLNKFNDLVAAGNVAEATKVGNALVSFFPDDPRVPQIKARVAALGNNQPAISAQPTGMDRVACDATLLLIQQAQQTTDPAERKAMLERFLKDSDPLTQKYPGLLQLWQSRAAVALDLDDARTGVSAAANLIKLGAVDSADPALRQLLAQLQLKDWLDPKKAEALLAQQQAKAVQEEQRSIAERRAAEADLAAKKALSIQFDPLVGDYYNLCAHWMLSKTEKNKLSLASGSISIAKIGDTTFHISGNVNAEGYPPNKRANVWLRYHFDNDLEPVSEADLQKQFPKAEDRANVASAAFVGCDGNVLQDINSGRPYRVTKMIILKLKDGNILFYGIDSPDTAEPTLKGIFGALAGFEYHPNGER